MNKNKMDKRGISLIVLVITIVVIIILAAAVIIALTSQGGIMDSAKKSKFMSDYRNVQEGVNVYSLSNVDKDNPYLYSIPEKGKLSLSDKQEIENNNPTLKTKIEELSSGKTLNDVDLYWIDLEKVGLSKLPKEKQEKGYIIDVSTLQIYDYVGDYFEGKRWHTLDGGVEGGEVTTPEKDVQEIWDGWVTLTLFYPSKATDKQWRLGTDGELRSDPMLQWQNYTGSITIPLDRTQDVWIRYNLDGETVIVPPAGTMLVDISLDNAKTLTDKVNVTISYDSEATTKEYRVGNSGWLEYTGPFVVTENTLIEARAKKQEKVYNEDGSLLMTRDLSGTDRVYVGNIGVEESELAAPTIARLAPTVAGEVAKVKVTYPENAVKKVYKVNYGVEENYTSEISVQKYGTYVIAYYYDASGKRSKSSAIYINDGTPQAPGTYVPNPPLEPGEKPPVTPGVDYPVVAAPTIVINPSSGLVTEVNVGVNSPATANDVYIKLGRYGNYQKYTSNIVVRQNMEVYAYYVTYSGERSETAHALVSNIKRANMPYVKVTASPYPWAGSYGASSVDVTINSSDATSVEYSEDGSSWKAYSAPFKVTQNKRIYARATNANGVSEDYLDITNIGNITAPPKKKNLAVNISVTPEPSLSTTRSNEVSVEIEYDENATEKTYRINGTGALQTYTQPFKLTNNATIYAYATSANGSGTAVKKIDNVIDGIAEPLIIANPSSNLTASKVNISIDFDKYASVKRYSVNGGTLTDYTSPFDVTTAGTEIYAYSQNSKGQVSTAIYKIPNIQPAPPVAVIDKGDYYLLKLNYPENSKGREYKWQEAGTWLGYKDDGILLIKPQYKDKVIQNGTLLKIEDENGNMVDFKGDYYLINVPINQIMNNIFMRWDRVTPSAPQILLNTSDPSREVNVDIMYDNSLKKKEYKIIKPDGSTDGWKEYAGTIKVTENNTVIYARGMDDAEVWSAEAVKKITNIDENPPEIKLTADLDTAAQKVSVRVAVTDDVEVGRIKWAKGLLGESYFLNGGTEIQNNSVVNITENDYYTFYAEDRVGNTQVSTLNVTNVDLTPPKIDIQVSPEGTVGLSATATINFGDSTIKQYKIGTSNATWTNYTTPVSLSSYTILTNNWQNTDKTVTIYAKGKDTAGNEVTVQKKL
ncbi:hypothetical protein D3C73_574540 [compost metagenome]